MEDIDVFLNVNVDEWALICSSLEYCIYYSDASLGVKTKLKKLLEKIETDIDI